MARPNKPSRLLLGVDIGGTEVKAGLFTERGRMLRFGTLPTRADQPPGRMARRLRGLVTPWLREQAGILRAAGVACAGLADPESGRLETSPNLPLWEGKAVGKIVGKALAADVLFDNDVNAAAYGEYRRGAGKGALAFLCVTVGTGVGGGLVLDGKLYRGVRNFAGEIGHVTIDRQGPRCSCGNRGCVEAYIGVAPIVTRARRLLSQAGPSSPLIRLAEGKARNLTPKLVGEAARAGDAGARAILREAGEALGTGLGSALNLLNLDRIAVGGGISLAGPALFEGIEKGCRKSCFQASYRAVSIVPAQLENRASVLGSALLAARHARSFRS